MTIVSQWKNLKFLWSRDILSIWPKTLSRKNMNGTSDLVIHEWKFQEILEIHEHLRCNSEYFDSNVIIGRHSIPLSVIKGKFSLFKNWETNYLIFFTSNLSSVICLHCHNQMPKIFERKLQRWYDLDWDKLINNFTCWKVKSLQRKHHNITTWFENMLEKSIIRLLVTWFT